MRDLIEQFKAIRRETLRRHLRKAFARAVADRVPRMRRGS